MAIKTLAALAVAALLGIGALTATAHAGSDCTTYCNRYTNSCETHCR